MMPAGDEGVSGYLERLGRAVERVKVFRLGIDSRDELDGASRRVSFDHRRGRLRSRSRSPGSRPAARGQAHNSREANAVKRKQVRIDS